MRSFAARDMLARFAIKAFVYPGTSGAHLPPARLRAGDVVLGAATVDVGNFFMARDGTIVRDEFGADPAAQSHYQTLYLDPRLLPPLACAAARVAARTALPPWLHGTGSPHPRILYYGMQGSSTMWLADARFIDAIDRVFHVVDEDGDWDSMLAATLAHVPFIEVSTIAGSVFQFPHSARGVPETPAHSASAGVLAQRISDAVAVALIERDGAAIVNGVFATPVTDPYPAGAFADPTNARTLLNHCSPQRARMFRSAVTGTELPFTKDQPG